MDDTEIWKPIEHCPHYEISSYGRVRSHLKKGYYTAERRFRDQPAIRESRDDGQGYKCVHIIHESGKHVCPKVHRLVARAFLGEPPEGFVCNHKDGVKTNNRVSNLEWVTRSENCLHAYRTGLHKRPPSMRHPRAKLTPEKAEIIRQRYNAGGASQWALAHEFHVSQMVIHRVVTGKGWHPQP